MIRYRPQCRLIIATLFLFTITYFVCYVLKIAFSSDGNPCITSTKENKASKISSITSKWSNNKTQWEYNALRKVMIAVSNITTEPIMVTVVNEGYVTLAQNWLCNTIEMGIHSKVLIVTTADHIGNALTAISTSVNIVTVVVNNELHNNLDYSHAGYLRLMNFRTKLIDMLIQNGKEVFLFECDFVWFQNPLRYFMNERGRFDMLLIPDTKDGKVINGGFYYLFPTNRTKSFFSKLTSMMTNIDKKFDSLDYKKPVPENENDQVYLSTLVTKKYAGVKYLTLSFTNFPSGLWYRTKPSDRKAWNPYVIHNNWIIGDALKVDRAKKYGHWFLDNESKCNISKVNDLTFL